MLIYLALCFVVGILLGLRFKVLVLIPATIVALASVAGVSGYAAVSGLVASAQAIALLELGYLIGAFLIQHLRRPLDRGFKNRIHAFAPDA